METSRVDGVKAPQHRRTPRNAGVGVDLAEEQVADVFAREQVVVHQDSCRDQCGYGELVLLK